MSIDNSNVIDFVGIEKDTGKLVLTISDHLGWESPADERLHLELLQDKINSYLAYIEDGQVRKLFPDAAERILVISIVAADDPVTSALPFFEVVRHELQNRGYEFRFELL